MVTAEGQSDEDAWHERDVHMGEPGHPREMRRSSVVGGQRLYVLKGDLGGWQGQVGGMCCCMWDPALSALNATPRRGYLYCSVGKEQPPTGVESETNRQGLFPKAYL